MSNRPITKAPPGAMKALRAVSSETLKAPLPRLEEGWAEIALGCQQRTLEALQAGKSLDARNYTWAGGVATDKVFAFHDMPTIRVEHLHEHRHDISSVMDKLAVAARVLSTHQRKGYVNVTRSGSTGPVAHLEPSAQNLSQVHSHLPLPAGQGASDDAASDA